MDELAKYCCQNSSCVDYGKRGLGNLSWCGWSGHRKEIRMIRCRTCQKMFSKRKGTPLFGCRLAPEKALSMLEHLSDGCGVRQTSRLTKVSRDTVSRYDDRLYIWGRSDFLPNNETSLRL
jgi:transposase-like protein